MSWDYLHLLTHPFPIVLATIGTGVGVVGWVLDREALERYGIFSLLIAGVLLILWGYNVSQSLSSQWSELVSGSPSDKVLALYAGGAVCALIGLFKILK